MNDAKFKIIKPLVIVILFTTHSLAFSQNDTVCNCPKIGLVLSGGGAKGFAHIGVLKVLDELGIQPDYITGTSMGAIIGGLHALGYSYAEIAEVTHNADWSKLLSDNIPLNKIVMEEKTESERYNLTFHLRNWEIKLPPGVVEGQQIEAKLKELSWPLPVQENFDSLPIPFHCTGVDLFSGQTVEMKSGDFTESLRGSMAIPSIFSPEYIDSMLIIDGGVRRNFPVQEAKKMGADIVIGVYVGFVDKVDNESLFSLSDILSRSTALSGIVDSREQMKYADILIQPDLKGLKAGDFKKSKKLEKYGEEAAREKYGELQQLAFRVKNCKKHKKKFNQPPKIKISKINVQGVKNIDKDFVIDYSGIEIGQYLTKEELAKAVELIYGTLHFTKVTYTLKKDSLSSEYSLTFKVKEKTRALLQLAFHFDNDHELGIRSNFTLRNIAIPNSKTSVSINIAKKPSFSFEFNKFAKNKQRLIGFTFFNLLKDKISLYSSKYELGNYHILSTKMGVGTKYSIGLNNQVKCQIERSSTRMFARDVGDYMIVLKDFSYHKTTMWDLNLNYKLNTTDDLYFPKRGIIFTLNYKHAYNVEHKSGIKAESYDYSVFSNFITDDFQSLFVDFSWHSTYFKRVSLALGLTIGLHSQQTGFWDDYSLGGISPGTYNNHVQFVGFGYGEIFDSNAVVAKLELDTKLYRNIYLSGLANVGYTGSELGKMWSFIEKNNFASYMQGYGAGFKIDLPFGPLKMMIGSNTQDKKLRLYISAGFPLY